MPLDLASPAQPANKASKMRWQHWTPLLSTASLCCSQLCTIYYLFEYKWRLVVAYMVWTAAMYDAACFSWQVLGRASAMAALQ